MPSVVENEFGEATGMFRTGLMEARRAPVRLSRSSSKSWPAGSSSAPRDASGPDGRRCRAVGSGPVRAPVLAHNEPHHDRADDSRVRADDSRVCADGHTARLLMSMHRSLGAAEPAVPGAPQAAHRILVRPKEVNGRPASVEPRQRECCPAGLLPRSRLNRLRLRPPPGGCIPRVRGVPEVA